MGTKRPQRPEITYTHDTREMSY